MSFLSFLLPPLSSDRDEDDDDGDESGAGEDGRDDEAPSEGRDMRSHTDQTHSSIRLPLQQANARVVREPHGEEDAETGENVATVGEDTSGPSENRTPDMRRTSLATRTLLQLAKVRLAAKPQGEQPSLDGNRRGRERPTETGEGSQVPPSPKSPRTEDDDDDDKGKGGGDGAGEAPAVAAAACASDAAPSRAPDVTITIMEEAAEDEGKKVSLLWLVENYQQRDPSLSTAVLQWFQQATGSEAQEAARGTNDRGETALHVLLRRHGARDRTGEREPARRFTAEECAGDDAGVLRAVHTFVLRAGAAATVRDARGLLPLHIACRDRACDAAVLRALIEAHPAGLGTASGRSNALSHTPFGWDIAASVGGHFSEFVAYVVATDARDAGPARAAHSRGEREARRTVTLETRRARHRLLSHCKDWVPLDILKKGMLNKSNLESKAMVRWLNEMPCKGSVVFFMMFEFYLHVLWIGTFMLAMERHLEPDASLRGWEPVALLVFAGLFFVGEFNQLYRFAITNAIGAYWLDVWNWIDLTAIGLVAASALEFIQQGGGGGSNDLLIMTGFFQTVLLISYLKKTFFPFSKFVTGVIKIFWVLVPFLVISAITLVTFSNMYYIKAKDSDLYAYPYGRSLQSSPDPYATLGESFVTVISKFAPGPLDENAENAGVLDYLFGILIIIVLMNVVIAVVSEAWEDATDEANEAFWNYRLDLILEKTRGGEEYDFSRLAFCKCFRGLDAFYINNDTVGTSTEDLGRALALAYREKGGRLFCFLAVTKSVVFIILGFPTFGFLWPKFFRQILFTPPVPKESRAETRLEHAVAEIEGCKADVAGCRTEIAALSAKVDTQIELMQRLLSKME